jgi:HSP20 family protein
MAIVRYDPMRMMLRWPNVWDEEDFSPTTNGNLDLYETTDEVVVKASVSGVAPDKVEITFEKGVLTIGAAEAEEESEGKRYYQKSSRSYAYRIAVPGNLDLSQEPEASFVNGVVKIVFKKAEEAKPKKITIKS